jgi:glyceraldehyde 3-phosphate dehydrogenase
VIEATGVFTKRDVASKHLQAGAKRVIISAPSKDADITICMGVNEDKFDPKQHVVISNASCTTNCLAPVAKVLHEEFGIVTGFLTTIHAVTGSQSIVDAPAKKWTRGRSAIANIVPTTTGAAIAATLVLPELEGKMDGMAMRVPVPVGSVIDFVAQTQKSVSVEKVNETFRNAAKSTRLSKILGVSDEPLVSSDIIGCTYSALIDAQSTMVLGDHTAKIIAWYDNEWGYARRVVDLALFTSKK